MKMKLSILTIVICVSIFILLPKDKKSTSQAVNAPNFIVVRVTPSPTIRPEQNLTVKTQVPGRAILADRIMAASDGYIEVKQADKLLAKIEIKAGETQNLNIPLVEETQDGDTLTVILYDKDRQQIEEHNVFITATSIAPGIPLPKDLQN